MKAHQKYNKGKEIEKLREIYIKYVYKGNINGNETEILNSEVLELLNSATTENDLLEIENMIDNLLQEGKITTIEHNYLMNLVNERRNEI